MDSARLKVLFLISSTSGKQGGAERFALALATHVPRDRIEPWMCFTRHAPDDVLQALEAAGVRSVSIGRHSRWSSYRMVELLRLLRREHFDVLHAHMLGSNLWGTVMGRLAGVPVLIAHEHTWSYRRNPLRAWADGRLIGRLATRFIAVSRADAERMVHYERVPAGKVLVMPTAYVPRADANGNIRDELGLDEDTPMVATAAVLRRQKAIDVLLEAHALLVRRIPAAHLVIAGNGPQRDALQARAHQLELDRQVHFMGARDDVDAILRRADAAALSSDFEGMPLFALECMANRTPLVATAVGGLPDMVENGVSGILVPPRAPEALADALSELLTDPARRTRMGVAAGERLGPFTIDKVASSFAELYEELVTERCR